MKISDAIKQLQAIGAKFGDLEIVGGCLMDETPLEWIGVVNKDGMEIYPKDPNSAGEANIAGVFLTS